jgi:hypothetical protein
VEGIGRGAELPLLITREIDIKRLLTPVWRCLAYFVLQLPCYLDEYVFVRRMEPLAAYIERYFLSNVPRQRAASDARSRLHKQNRQPRSFQPLICAQASGAGAYNRDIHIPHA